MAALAAVYDADPAGPTRDDAITAALGTERGRGTGPKAVGYRLKESDTTTPRPCLYQLQPGRTARTGHDRALGALLDRPTPSKKGPESPSPV